MTLVDLVLTNNFARGSHVCLTARSYLINFDHMMLAQNMLALTYAFCAQSVLYTLPEAV